MCFYFITNRILIGHERIKMLSLKSMVRFWYWLINSIKHRNKTKYVAVLRFIYLLFTKTESAILQSTPGSKHTIDVLITNTAGNILVILCRISGHIIILLQSHIQIYWWFSILNRCWKTRCTFIYIIWRGFPLNWHNSEWKGWYSIWNPDGTKNRTKWVYFTVQ